MPLTGPEARISDPCVGLLFSPCSEQPFLTVVATAGGRGGELALRRHVAGLLPRRTCCGRGGKSVGRADDRADSFRSTVTPPEEVRPMTAGSAWVLPLALAVTVGPST
ncbi:hypothetical protein GCM10023335_50680 [Streptomyces siamensis]|uniref:Uncharacterized protein n=1 Tax=Streptomyces siamensis TaxID=1274986 RepID=A0ABP9J6Q4_9ACTN